MEPLAIILGLVGLIVGAIASYIILKNSATSIINKAQKDADALIESAKNRIDKDRKELELEKKQQQIDIREYKSNVEKELEKERKQIAKIQEDNKVNQMLLDQKLKEVEKRDAELDSYKKSLDDFEDSLKQQEEEIVKKRESIETKLEQYREKLEAVANMTAEEAKQELIESMIAKAKQEAEKIIREIKEKAEEEGKKEAKKILSLAIQKCSVDHTVDTTVTVLALPSDEMKGRIIGRTGRNIRAFENATGVDVIVDDTPEAVVLSSFDPVRREIAKLTLEKLIVDGRIHPTRIEELVEKSEQEVAEIIKETGTETVYELGVVGLHPEIIKLIGKLKYRTSYGQSILQHSIEVGYLCGFIAGELGLDVDIAKRAGLLHDIGKAVDREQEGTHALIGAELAQKYGEKEIVVNAIAAHHEEVEPISPYAQLAAAADSISSSRPGARRETLETYIKRVKKLEEIATSFEGVKNSYAVQAGREIRVIVEPNKINDDAASILANDIAEKIQQEMQYPGYIKVSIIREVRYTGYAK